MKAHRPTTTNWRDYNHKLESRGSLNLWLDADLIKDLNCGRVAPPEGGNGRPFVFPDVLIELLLTIRTFYNMPLRQTMGMARSLFPLVGLDEIILPHFSTLSRRASRIEIALDPISSKGPIHLAIDSTGLKVYGEGEWKVRQHGAGKRRTWRKVHFGINTKTFMVHAVVVTTNDVHDSPAGVKVVDLIDEDIECVLGDGAYDTGVMRQKIKERGAIPIIPPRDGARIHPDTPYLKERNEAIAFIKEGLAQGLSLHDARKAWKKASRYHQRSLSETHMYRFKNAFSEKLRSRLFENQAAEIFVKTKLLNKITAIGMPNIKKVA